jgi:hypothetical protein
VLVDSHGDEVVLVEGTHPYARSASVFKLDGPTGAVRWGPVSIPRGSLDFGACRIGLDANGDVFWAGTDAAGISYGKFDGASGEPLWGPRMFSDGYPQLTDIAVVGGDFGLLAIGSGLQLWRIRGTDGSVAFGPLSVAGIEGGYSQPLSLVSGAGVFVVCAKATTAVDAATGSIRWGPVATLYADSCQLDSLGNVFRTASSYAPNPGARLQKLSASSGATLWERFDADKYGERIRVDPGGDVLVAVPDAQFGFDLRKLSGSSGALLWGPVAWNDSQFVQSGAVDMAVTPGGDALVMAYAYDVTAPRTVILRLSNATGVAVAEPILFGGQSAASPTSLALSGEWPVFGVLSSTFGAAVVSFAPAGP